MAIFLLKYVLFLEYLSNVTFLITAVEIYGQELFYNSDVICMATWTVLCIGNG